MSLTNLIKYIEAISEYTGRIIAWCVPLLVFIICYDVAMRYLFQIGSVTLQELEWHLFSLIFLLGAAYTFKHDGHVRVDIFHKSRRCSERQRAWIDIAGTLLFLFPFCLLIIFSAWPFIANSFIIAEGSPDPGGLPFRYLLKASIAVAFALLILQGLANLLKSVLFLKTGIHYQDKNDGLKDSGRVV